MPNISPKIYSHTTQSSKIFFTQIIEKKVIKIRELRKRIFNLPNGTAKYDGIEHKRRFLKLNDLPYLKIIKVCYPLVESKTAR